MRTGLPAGEGNVAPMMNLLRKIAPLRLAPSSEDTDRAAAILSKELPFTVHEYASGAECNGWTVPMKWRPVRAEIWKDGVLVYDGMKHPLGVVGYSTSFQGTVSLDELKKHLFYHPGLPDSLVYHCDYFYKQWKRDWGFSVTHTLFDDLEDGEYEIHLETIFETGTMKVLDFFLPGERQDTIVLNAHNCHAAQANDGISGVVVGIEVMKKLQKQRQRRYSYRLIVAPEHLGTVFYLNSLPKGVHRTFCAGIFLEMLGTNGRFALQESFTGKSRIDRAAVNYLRHHYPDYFQDRFRKIVGNDETVWEAPGYEVPFISLSRWPYPEYHSDRDDDRIISEDRMKEAVDVVLGISRIFETDSRMRRHFNGLVALSNPKFDLYIATSDPSIRTAVPEEQRRWNYLMDCIIRYFDGTMTVLDISEIHDLDHGKVYNYIKRFEEKGLVSLSDTV
jgi:aminopeptidase-like protein